eukprot:518052_1
MTHSLYTVVLPLMLIGTAFIFLFWLTLLYQLCISKENALIAQESYRNMKHAYDFYRYTAVGCFTFCLFTAILDAFHGYLSFHSNHAMLLTHYSIIKGSADLTYFIASLNLNLLIFGRCFFTFKYSVFALSTWTIGFMSLQIISSILLSMGYCFLMFAVGNEQVEDNYGAPLMIGIFINDLTISLSMLSLFIYKLHSLIASISSAHITAQQQNSDKQHATQGPARKNMDSNLSDYLYSFTSGKQIKETSARQVSVNSDFDTYGSQRSGVLSNLLPTVRLDAHQLGLVEVITKHTILSGFAIFFNQMWYSLAYVSMTPSFESSVWFGLFIYGMRLIGMLGITLSIYLSMKFSQTIYFHCCQCCHFNCYKCCMNWSRQTMNNKTKK